MWTKEQRAIYWRDEDRYPSNLTDVEWERLKPLIPEAGPGGRPRKTDMWAARNAGFYLICTWWPCRYLPRDEFPEDRYPSNLTDVEWERLKPLIPEAGPGGRPRKTDMRAAMNAIFYLLRTGCPWRYLPRDEFPPRSTVYNIFRKFQKDGVWEAIWEELHVTLREQLGREASPTAAVIDSQTLKAAEKGAVLMAR